MAGISVKPFFLRASAAAPIFSLSRHRDVRHLFYFAPMARCSGGAKSGASAQHCLYGLIFLINKLLMYILNGTRKTTFDIFKLLSSLIQYVDSAADPEIIESADPDTVRSTIICRIVSGFSFSMESLRTHFTFTFAAKEFDQTNAKTGKTRDEFKLKI